VTIRKKPKGRNKKNILGVIEGGLAPLDTLDSMNVPLDYVPILIDNFSSLGALRAQQLHNVVLS